MARSNVWNVEIGFDEETGDLIKQLVRALDRIADVQATDTEVSFGDPRRLYEKPTPYQPYWVAPTWNPTWTATGNQDQSGYTNEDDT